MVVPFRLRRALFALVLLFHGIGLCVAAGDEASTGEDAIAAGPALALLLPLASADFARPAEAVKLGFTAAHKHSRDNLSFGVIPTDASSESILSGYDRAVKQGARLVIGPLTRSGVSALAASRMVSVTTIGLNLPEDRTELPPRFYTFGLALEAEAQQVAETAFAEHFRSAILVSAKSPLAQRSRDAFADAWKRLGGSIKAAYEFGPQTDLPALREALSTTAVDMIFLSADTQQARTVRPFLNNLIDVFATSQVNSAGKDAIANVDLNGIRFVEMPWLMQPDHPAVMVYPHAEGITEDMERFYALGIDAYRVAAALIDGPRRLSLDGVTGKLTLDGSQVTRAPAQAVFRNGVCTSLDHDEPDQGQR